MLSKKPDTAEKHFHRSIPSHQSKEIIKNDSLKKFDLSENVIRSYPFNYELQDVLHIQ
jgi:hypothetical protein